MIGTEAEAEGERGKEMSPTMVAGGGSRERGREGQGWVQGRGKGWAEEGQHEEGPYLKQCACFVARAGIRATRDWWTALSELQGIGRWVGIRWGTPGIGGKGCQLPWIGGNRVTKLAWTNKV